MRLLPIAASLALLAAGCTKNDAKPGDTQCTQDGKCPAGLSCFADWRCYPPGYAAECQPACFGSESFCDTRTLRCVECLTDAHCLVGFVCVAPNLRCQPGCSAAKPQCTHEKEQCDVDMGACRGCLLDTECENPSLPRCQSDIGRCVACLPDSDNCSAGTYCAGTSGNYACVTGACKAATDCAGGGAQKECCDHQCVDLAIDANNCGGCGVVCRANRSCCGGQCVDLTTDADNCGACGASCALPNVRAVKCIAAKCSNGGCEDFFGNCDGDLQKNGCEANLTADPNNCYGCGQTCRPFAPNTAASCTVSGCSVGPCLAGWGNCNGNNGDGCEVNLMTDKANCGSCATACAANQSCSNGACR